MYDVWMIMNEGWKMENEGFFKNEGWKMDRWKREWEIKDEFEKGNEGWRMKD